MERTERFSTSDVAQLPSEDGGVYLPMPSDGRYDAPNLWLDNNYEDAGGSDLPNCDPFPDANLDGLGGSDFGSPADENVNLDEGGSDPHLDLLSDADVDTLGGDNLSNPQMEDHDNDNLADNDEPALQSHTGTVSYRECHPYLTGEYSHT